MLACSEFIYLFIFYLCKHTYICICVFKDAQPLETFACLPFGLFRIFLLHSLRKCVSCSLLLLFLLKNISHYLLMTLSVRQVDASVPTCHKHTHTNTYIYARSGEHYRAWQVMRCDIEAAGSRWQVWVVSKK